MSCPRNLFPALSALLIALPLAGCHIDEHKSSKGDNVDISTPFASMHVKTDQEANVAGIGLTQYPGSVPVKEHEDKDNDAADINMSFGDFHLMVKAASFQTGDSAAKVEAFYRKDMAKYGEVIKCNGDKTIGQPARTSQGLTCEDEEHNHHGGGVQVSDEGETQLRAGSPSHQHIVGMEPKDGGTKIGLIMLELPKGLHMHTGDDKGSSE
jgi:hypothetical protein